MVQLIELVILAVFSYVLWCVLKPNIKVKDRRELGVKRATAIYKDEKGTKLLVANSLGLQGKPDFIFKTWIRKKYIPLEIKSGKLNDDNPHDGDLYQLAAYFIIIEEVYGKRPPYGKLVYSNKTFKVRNTFALRKEVHRITKEMRAMLDEDYSPCASPDFMKCKHCICKDTVCEWQD